MQSGYKITVDAFQVLNFQQKDGIVFTSILVTALAEYEARKPSKQNRHEVLEMLTYSMSHAYIIAGESDPDVALLDLISMVTLGRIIFEEDGPKTYGKAVEPVIQGFRKAEKDIRQPDNDEQ